ncbi:Crp/Fnr family transcriptional regulator [Leadbetterella byssophila]|uniref:Crp/Fnr family transcriptional regulator n=1 Tax=Leadbetterella byssophila TaxID=316068 RepID=UPI0039A30EB4
MKTIAITEEFLNLKNMMKGLSEEEWVTFSEIWTKKTYPKGSLLTMQGDPENYIYFVLEGIQRIYHSYEDGKEATIIFSYPYSFSGVIDAALTGTPSRYFFETLSSSTFLKAPAQKFLELSRTIPALSGFVQNALAQNIKGLLEKMVEVQSLKSEEKFIRFMQRSPHMLHKVPQRYLANYLGIDPTNFSKLMNKVSI